MIEEALRARLLAVAGVTALVSTRVYPVVMPQDPTFPCVTYQRLGEVRHLRMGAPAPLNDVVFQVDAWAEGFQACKTLAAAIRTALDAVSWTAGAETVQVAYLQTEEDGYEDAIPCFRVTQRYRVAANA